MADPQSPQLATAPVAAPNPTLGTAPGPGNLSVDELAGKLRDKFPGAYNDWDNSKLVHATIQKFPVFQTWLSKDAISKIGATPVAPVTGVEGAMTGFTKGGLETIQGVTKLANKVLPSGVQIPILGAGIDTEAHGGAETVGKIGENVAEFAAGEGALKGIASLSKLSKVPGLLELAERFPKTLKILSAATVGTAQGGVKGAAKDEAGAGAIGGGAGGFIGGALGEAVTPGLKVLGRMLGVDPLGTLGSYTSEQAMVKAGRPSVTEDAAFRKGLQVAAPRIIDAAKKFPLNTVGDFVDMLGTVKQQIRATEFGPMIQRNANEVLSGAWIQTNMQKAITPQMKKFAPEEAKEIADFAKLFNRNFTLGQAEGDLQWFNAELSKFYKMDPAARAANLKINGTIAKYEAAADGLRDVIYGRLKSLGEPNARLMNQQYGALKDLERVFAKRATIADRAAPFSLPDAIAFFSAASEAVASFAMGHPLAALGAPAMLAARAIAKRSNAPETLARMGVRAMTREAAPPSLIFAPIKTATGQFLKSATGAGGTYAGGAAAGALSQKPEE